MAGRLVGVSRLEKKAARKASSPDEGQRAAVRELVKAARARGEALTGPDGLLKTITATVLESALEEEMSEHLGYDKHHPPPENSPGNVRNGTRSKTAVTEAAGEVSVQVPRDRAGSFEPVIVRKRQRRLSDVDAVAISLYAKGLTTVEISALRRGVRRASASKDTVSRITDEVVEDMQAWCSRPLLPVYAAIFVDAIYVKVRDGQVGNQPFYAAIGVDLEGHRDVLGLWAGHGGGESAKYWMSVLTDLRNRGVRDVFFIV
jgi:transposase-like protein